MADPQRVDFQRLPKEARSEYGSDVWEEKRITLPRRGTIEAPLYKVTPQAFIDRAPIPGADELDANGDPLPVLHFSVGGLYLGDAWEGDRWGDILAWMGDPAFPEPGTFYRLVADRGKDAASQYPDATHPCRYIPILTYRDDLISGKGEPGGGLAKFFDLLDWVPEEEWEGRKAWLLAQGWSVEISEGSEWTQARVTIGTVPHVPNYYCTAVQEPRLIIKSVLIDNRRTGDRHICKVLEACDRLQLSGAMLGTKRAWHQPRRAMPPVPGTGRSLLDYYSRDRDSDDLLEWHNALPGPLYDPEGAEHSYTYSGHNAMRVRCGIDYDSQWARLADAVMRSGRMAFCNASPAGWPNANQIDWMRPDVRWRGGDQLWQSALQYLG